MADVSAPIAAVAASGIAYPTAMAIGIPDVLAMPVAVAAAGGASWAMSNRERIKQYTVLAVLRALAAWVFSWLFGVIFGPALASFAIYWLPVGAAQAVPHGGLAVGFALVLSAVAISHALPMVLRQIDRRVDRIGGE